MRSDKQHVQRQNGSARNERRKWRRRLRQPSQLGCWTAQGRWHHPRSLLPPVPCPLRRRHSHPSMGQSKYHYMCGNMSLILPMRVLSGVASAGWVRVWRAARKLRVSCNVCDVSRNINAKWLASLSEPNFWRTWRNETKKKRMIVGFYVCMRERVSPMNKKERFFNIFLK